MAFKKRNTKQATALESLLIYILLFSAVAGGAVIYWQQSKNNAPAAPDSISTDEHASGDEVTHD